MLRLAYIGNHVESLELLLQDPELDVRAINLNPELLRESWNPADHLFQRIYRDRRERPLARPSGLELALLRRTAPLMTSPFREYAAYLDLAARTGLRLVDFDDAAEGVRYIRAEGIELLVVNDWWMLAGSVVSAPRLGAINVHPSILPAYRGSLPTLWSLRNGDLTTAVSYMVLTAGMDNGHLIAQHGFRIAESRDPLALEQQINAVIRRTLVSDLKRYAAGELRPVPQATSGASKTAKYEAYRKISWEAERARDIVDKIRYYPHMWPTHACHTSLGGERVELWAAQLEASTYLRRPGEYVLRPPRLFVRAVDGELSVDLWGGVRGRSRLRLVTHPRGRFDG